jgi:hypothetical protein
MFRSELQPAARRRGKRPDLADHRGNAGGAQPLLHRPQELAIARRRDQHDMPGVEPVGRKSWTVEIRAREAPQNKPIFCRMVTTFTLTPTLSAL